MLSAFSQQHVVNVCYLGCHIQVFKPLDIQLASVYPFRSAHRTLQHRRYGLCQRLMVIGMHVNAVWSSCFFQTRACTRHDRQTTLYGFDDGNAKTLVTRGINKAFCLLINGR